METGKDKDGSVGLTYPMLTKSNYTAWALKMKVYMQAHGIWKAVNSTKEKDAVEDKTDKMALAAIYQGIPEDVLLSLADKETAKEAWEAVKTICLGAERLSGFVTNIRALGETVDEAYVITATIEQFGNLDTMTIEEAVGSLKVHEERLRGKSEVGGEQLLFTEEEWRKREKNDGHLLLTREEWPKWTNKGDASLGPKGERRKDVKTEAHLTQVQGDDEPALLLVEHRGEERNQLLLNEQDTVPKLSHNSDKRLDSCVWYLDNGASNHMTGFRSKFKILDDKVTGLVLFGDGSTLSEHGNKVILKEEFLWVYDGQERLIMKVQRSANRLYKIFLETVSERIIRQFTTPYTPQQNGVVERRNITVVEMARSMLKTMQVPSEYWGEAAPHSVYVLNRLPTRALSDKTPYEAWTKTKPDVGQIKKPGTKGFRLYDPNSRTMHVSRDVIFEESMFWDWNKQETESSTRGTFILMKSNSDQLDQGESEGHGSPDTSQTSDATTESDRPQSSSASTGSDTTDIQSSTNYVSGNSDRRESYTQESDVSSQPRQFRLLSDIYNDTEEIKAESELFLMGIDAPNCYKEAATDQAWKKAMQDELKSIE
ncbi:uncharacterized protein LOC141710547 [Apium graveolens]|uniref:uncharacterized protein LOC141710547 n=1 Tax=Apium graveolens TaxID=4045 RepID=UPI003D7A0124